MLVWVHVAAAFVLRFVPARVAYQLVAAGTPLALLFARGYYARAFANMRQVLGPGAPRSVVEAATRNAFRNYARYMVDLVRMANADVRDLGSNARISGWEHLDGAYDEGKGVVLVTGHVGNWDLAAGILAARGRIVSAPVETLKPPAWNARVQSIRERVGLRTIPLETGVRDMIAALRRGEGLAVLVDRPLRDSGVVVRFFGRPTRVPAGAATLAMRTGAAMVPVAFLRAADGHRFEGHIGPAIRARVEGRLSHAEAQEQVQQLTQAVVSWLEDMIRHHPDQWYMFRNMWPLEVSTLEAGGLQPVSAA